MFRQDIKKQLEAVTMYVWEERALGLVQAVENADHVAAVYECMEKLGQPYDISVRRMPNSNVTMITVRC